MAAGIDVPGELSLVSFDDRLEEVYPYAISSVNFGFEELGYTAFHIMPGDISIRPDGQRTMHAKCRLNHCATIGPARKRDYL